MDLDDIRLFVKVAELKSFVKAAQDLHIQTSLLSRRINRLESALGIRLLQRTTRKVSLTEEGARFLAETSRGLNQIHSAVDSLNSLHGAPKGTVRITSPIELGQLLVETIMTEFFDQYPEIQIEWELASANKGLVENGIDLAIRPGHSSEQSLVERKIGSLALHLFCSPKLKLLISRRPSIDELEQLPWLVFTRGPMDTLKPKIQLETSHGTIEIQPKNIRFRTNSLMSVKYAMVNGVGIGLLPSPISEPEVKKGTLIPVLPNSLRGPTTDFYAVYPSREYLAPKVRVLLEWLSERFPNR